MAGKADRESSDSSDEDTVATISTVESEQKDYYEVEGILAERTVNGITEYLVKWKGYPDHRHTWEGEGQFDNEDTLFEWNENKMRISRGLLKPFDVLAWERAKSRRQERRREKKKKRGLPVAEKSSSTDHSSDEDFTSAIDEQSDSTGESHNTDDVDPWSAKEENALLESLSKLRAPYFNAILESHGSEGTVDDVLRHKTQAELERKTRLLHDSFKDSGRTFPIDLHLKPRQQTKGKEREALTHKTRRRPRKRVIDSDDSTSSDEEFTPIEALIPDVLDEPTSKITTANAPNTISATSESLTKESQRTTKSVGMPSKVVTLKVPKVSPLDTTSKASVPPVTKLTQSFTTAGKPVRFGGYGRGPARSNSSTITADKGPKPGVFANWDKQTKQRKSRLTLPVGGEKETGRPQKFKKLAIQNSVRKAARNELAPNPDSLVFLNRKDGKVIAPAKSNAEGPQTIKKKPFDMVQEQLTKSPSTSILVDDINSNENEGLNDSDVAEEITFVATNQPTRRSSVPLETYMRKHDSSQLSSVAPIAVMGGDRIKHPTLQDQGQYRIIEKPDNSTNIDKIQRPPTGPRRMLSDTTAEFSRRKHDELYAMAEDANSPEPVTEPSSLYPPVSSGTRFIQYRERATNDVVGQILVGPEKENIGSVTFKGLQEWHMKDIFLTIKIPPHQVHVICRSMCTAGEYAAIFHNPQKYIGSGWVHPFKDTIKNLDVFTEMLLQHASGSLFFAKRFTMLIYPAHCLWDWLDEGLRPVTQDAALRFAMLDPWPKEPQLMEQPPNPYPQSIFQAGVKSLNTVFKTHYGIEYSRLVAHSKGTKEDTTQPGSHFFLIFPPDARMECEFLTDFLNANDTVSVYKYEDQGAWDYFKLKVDNGVIISHKSFCDYWAIPQLARTLRKSISMFSFSLVPMSPLDPDPHLIRLFPSGRAILLTDFMFLFRPLDTARILRWFRLWILTSRPPRSWKICTRTAIQKWLHLIWENVDEPLGEDYVTCIAELMRLVPREDREDWDVEVPKEYAPVVCMFEGVRKFDRNLGTGVLKPANVDKKAVLKNDITLCEWFATWAISKRESFRRFDIITGSTENSEGHKSLKDSMKRNNLVELFTFEKFCEVQGVPNWGRINQEDEKQRAVIKEQKRKQSVEGEKKVRRERKERKPGLDGCEDVEMSDSRTNGEEDLFVPMETSE
ncbi:MAG: hypothetical protein Q9167_006709 [Letrouitia subvulpina]